MEIQNEQVVLGYWKIRGLAQAIRYLLEYAGVNYSEFEYEQGDAPDFCRESWLSVKYNLGLDFPNLPYFIDGDLKFTESAAIMRYITRKWCKDLQGKSDEDFAIVEMLVGVIHDIKQVATMHCYGSGDVQQFRSDSYTGLLPVYKFLGNKKYLVGDYLTYVDFIFYELCELIAHVTKKEVYEKFPNLITYKNNVENLEKISAYLASDRFMSSPFNNKIAKIN